MGRFRQPPCCFRSGQTDSRLRRDYDDFLADGQGIQIPFYQQSRGYKISMVSVLYSHCRNTIAGVIRFGFARKKRKIPSAQKISFAVYSDDGSDYACSDKWCAYACVFISGGRACAYGAELFLRSRVFRDCRLVRNRNGCFTCSYAREIEKFKKAVAWMASRYPRCRNASEHLALRQKKQLHILCDKWHCSAFLPCDNGLFRKLYSERNDSDQHKIFWFVFLVKGHFRPYCRRGLQYGFFGGRRRRNRKGSHCLRSWKTHYASRRKAASHPSRARRYCRVERGCFGFNFASWNSWGQTGGAWGKKRPSSAWIRKGEGAQNRSGAEQTLRPSAESYSESA